MLILTRRVGESIIIGDDVRIHILEVKELEVPEGKVQQYQVRLGIEAPRSIPIYREEVFRLIQAGALQIAPWVHPPAAPEAANESQPAPSIPQPTAAEVEDEFAPIPLFPAAAALQPENGDPVASPDPLK